MSAFVPNAGILRTNGFWGNRRLCSPCNEGHCCHQPGIELFRKRIRRESRNFAVKMVAEVQKGVAGEMETGTGMGTELRGRMEELRVEVERALERVLRRVEGREGKLVQAMRYAVLGGGKRLRPILVLESCAMFGQAHDAMAAAVAVELIHTMSLVHDDLPCMDDDDFRRGRRSCHIVFGDSMAVLAGDALLAKAFEVVATGLDHVNPGRVLRVLAKLAECVGQKGLAGGQVIDIESEGRDDVDIETLEWIHTHKTAALLQVSCVIGAIIGGASEEDVDRLSRFARKIGLAFQVTDDLLDVTASTKALGKTAGKDQQVNKVTYPKLLGLEGARAKAEMLISEAKECLRPYGDRAKVLLALADFIIKRKS